MIYKKCLTKKKKKNFSLFEARGMPLDATQEMLTLGLCNVVGSFFHSMPVTGSFSRSAVNNASGVKTPLGGIYTGEFCRTARFDAIARRSHEARYSRARR